MAGLPKSIIRKYGVSKKAWAVFRGQRQSRRASTAGVTRSANRRTQVVSVARRRRGFRRFGRSVARAAASPTGIAVGAMAYGAVRSKVSNALAPLTSKVPLGSIGDELVLGAAGYMLAKKARNKNLRTLGIAMLAVESARVGEALADGSAF